MCSEKEYIDDIKEKYGFQAWMRQVKIPNKISNRYLPNHGEITDFIFERRQAIPNTNYAFVDYFRHKEDEAVQIEITISKHDNTAESHKGLLDILLGCTAMSIPTGTEKGIEVGDVSFCVQSLFCEDENTQTAIFYTRNNVLVQLQSIGSKNYHLADIAEVIDKQIINQLN